jgi:hypothetical protein
MTQGSNFVVERFVIHPLYLRPLTIKNTVITVDNRKTAAAIIMNNTSFDFGKFYGFNNRQLSYNINIK